MNNMKRVKYVSLGILVIIIPVLLFICIGIYKRNHFLSDGVIGVVIGNSQLLMLLSFIIIGIVLFAFWLFYIIKKPVINAEYTYYGYVKMKNKSRKNRYLTIFIIITGIICSTLSYFGIYERIEITENKIKNMIVLTICLGHTRIVMLQKQKLKSKLIDIE
jgi:magnesium-transporting ATPase (P-type)